MDLTYKIIPVFFILILAANYINFMSYFYVLNNVPGKKGRTLRRRTKPYFYVMQVLYAAVLSASMVPGLHPRCTE